MEALNPGIYPLSIIVFLFTALLILVFFRLFKYLIQFLRLSRKQGDFLIKYLPVVELVVWFIFFIWAIQYLYNRGYLITIFPLLVFIIIILYLAWFGLKDVIAGVIFKTTNTLRPNDHISVAGISGRVTYLGQGNLKIEDNAGRIVSIPYSKIVGKIIQMHYPSQSLLSHHFIFRIPLKNSPNGVFELIEKMRVTILTLPWASQKKEPKISIKEEDANQILLSVTIFSLDVSYFIRIEKYLEKEFNGKVVI